MHGVCVCVHAHTHTMVHAWRSEKDSFVELTLSFYLDVSVSDGTLVHLVQQALLPTVPF